MSLRGNDYHGDEYHRSGKMWTAGDVRVRVNDHGLVTFIAPCGERRNMMVVEAKALARKIVREIERWAGSRDEIDDELRDARIDLAYESIKHSLLWDTLASNAAVDDAAGELTVVIAAVIDNWIGGRVREGDR